jgi:hypothetical protein
MPLPPRGGGAGQAVDPHGVFGIEGKNANVHQPNSPCCERFVVEA